jgi:hypothetical protein
LAAAYTDKSRTKAHVDGLHDQLVLHICEKLMDQFHLSVGGCDIIYHAAQDTRTCTVARASFTAQFQTLSALEFSK